MFLFNVFIINGHLKNILYIIGVIIIISITIICSICIFLYFDFFKDKIVKLLHYKKKYLNDMVIWCQ